MTSNEVKLEPIDIRLDSNLKKQMDTRPASRQSIGNSRKVSNSIELSKGSLKFSNKAGHLTTKNVENIRVDQPAKFYRTSKREQEEID